jgi:hypothetical protein
MTVADPAFKCRMILNRTANGHCPAEYFIIHNMNNILNVVFYAVFFTMCLPSSYVRQRCLYADECVHPSGLYTRNILNSYTYDLSVQQKMLILLDVTSISHARSTCYMPRAAWFSSNAPDSYPGGAQIESRPGHVLSWLRFLCFPQPLEAIPGIVPLLGHDCFLPNPFQLEAV